MIYVLINRGSDGVHTSIWRTQEYALKALADFIGRDTDDLGRSLHVGRTYYGDGGNRLTVERRSDGWTKRKEDAVRRAFDARECGVATKRQLALLDREGF